ncbi:MAG: glycosyl transferase family 2 [Acidobacteriaceae bacterium]|nr:glycosyl transferase family 2 [Acidobacteriaceae bacterium]
MPLQFKPKLPVKVCCLMATQPGREKFRPQALESFCSQVYPAGWVVQLLVDADPHLTLGAKLNRMAVSTTADYLVTWDDDDLHSVTRVQRQIEPLLDGYDYSWTSTIHYHDLVTDDHWIYQGQPKFWLGGLAFRRTRWEKQKFLDITIGCDTRWEQSAQRISRPSILT